MYILNEILLVLATKIIKLLVSIKSVIFHFYHDSGVLIIALSVDNII